MAPMNAALATPPVSLFNAPERETHSRVLLRLRIPIAISGVDMFGEHFAEATGTELVSPSGATLDCSRALAPSQEIVVRSANREILARVVGQTGVSERGHSYAVVFLQQDHLFWGVSFPKAGSSGRTPSLECSGCSQRMTSAMNEIEALVLRANRKVLMHCSVCGGSELWKVPEPLELQEELQIERFGAKDQAGHATERSADDPDLVPLASLQNVDMFRPAPRGERRRHKRVRLAKAKACIELPGTERDIIDIVDVSRGGACVRSTHFYPMGSWIRIACPYTIGGSNIFQPARIVRVIVGDNFKEYGVEYVRLA